MLHREQVLVQVSVDVVVLVELGVELVVVSEILPLAHHHLLTCVTSHYEVFHDQRLLE